MCVLVLFHSRKLTTAIRGKEELRAVVQANARHSIEVANAVDRRDLGEVKRIVDRAKLSRREFLSACDRLGFQNAHEPSRRPSTGGCGDGDDGVDNAPASKRADQSSPSDIPSEAVMEAQAAEVPETTLSVGSGKAGDDSSMFDTVHDHRGAMFGDGSVSVGATPVFFLDAEGRGGTTALALATIQNDIEMVRRLVKEVSGRVVGDCGRQSFALDTRDSFLYQLRASVRRMAQTSV